jgi:hypothetical protein
MAGAGDVLLMACTWRGSRPSFRTVSTARIIPPVIDYQFTQGNGCAAAGGGLNGSGPPDCASPVAVTAGGVG